VQLVDTSGSLLYATVAQQETDETMLKVTFTIMPDSYGTFEFQGSFCPVLA
jgi:hypothetical protein